jgi:hypothetical protein
MAACPVHAEALSFAEEMQKDRKDGPQLWICKAALVVSFVVKRLELARMHCSA